MIPRGEVLTLPIGSRQNAIYTSGNYPTGGTYMMSLGSRSWIVVAIASLGLSLLVPGAALGAKALFRVERTFLGAPFPPVTTPGSAGVYENYIEPYTTAYPPAVATIQNNTPTVGSPFTLPRSFIYVYGTFSTSAFPGYTSIGAVKYVNGRGRFRPKNPYGATMTTRVVFPTTQGNPTPNYGNGAPVTPTTTFNGRFDVSRGGSIFITPGPNRFGGTMRILYDPTSSFFQNIKYFAPTYFYGYGSYRCQVGGIDCTQDLEETPGQITSSGKVFRYLLTTTTTTGTPMSTNMFKAKTATNSTNYIYSKAYYLRLVAPFTTGFIKNVNVRDPYPVSPQVQGYDKNLGDVDITVTRTSTTYYYTSSQMYGYKYYTLKQYLTGVTRVVSMVRARMLHSMLDPRPQIPPDPITAVFQAARLATLKVFFLPEPRGMILMGVGLAAVAGMALFRRR